MLLDTLRLQGRVTGALIVRELHTRYGRDNLGFLWLMIEPLIFAAGVLFMWRVLRGAYDHDLPLIPLTLFGYLPLLLIRHMAGHAIYSVRDNGSLLYHRQVTVLSIYFSRVAFETAGNILAFAFAFIVLYVTGEMDWPKNMPLLYLGYFYLVWYTAGVTAVLMALSERSELVEKLWGPYSYLTIPLSGAYIMALWVPPPWREWYLLMPSVHAYEMMRSGYFGDILPVFWSQAYVAFWSAGLTLLGLWLLRDTQRHLALG